MTAPLEDAPAVDHDDAMRSADNALAGYKFAFPSATLKVLARAYKDVVRRNENLSEAGGELVERLLMNADLRIHGVIVGYNEHGAFGAWPHGCDEDTPAIQTFNDADFASAFEFIAARAATTKEEGDG